MTKAQLVAAVANELDESKRSVARTIDATFEQIARSIKREKRFWVPGFGTFSVRRHKARAGFNPHANAPMTIPAARSVGFRAAPELKKGL
jgi:DNA-binding protein HU-beta